MGRAANATADYLYIDGAHIIETGAMAFSVWARPQGSSTARRILSFNDGVRGFQCSILGDSNDYFHAIGNNGSTSTSHIRKLPIAGSITDGNWYHICGSILADRTISSAYLEGVAMTDTGGGNWSTGTDNDQLVVGARNGGGLIFDGDVAEVAVWLGIELTQAEASALNGGASPLLIQTDSLVTYMPLYGSVAADEVDLISGKVATIVSGKAGTDHPPVPTIPTWPRNISAPAAAAAGTILPMVASNYYNKGSVI